MNNDTNSNQQQSTELNDLIQGGDCTDQQKEDVEMKIEGPDKNEPEKAPPPPINECTNDIKLEEDPQVDDSKSRKSDNDNMEDIENAGESTSSGSSSRSSSKPGGYSADCSSISNCSDESSETNSNDESGPVSSTNMKDAQNSSNDDTSEAVARVTSSSDENKKRASITQSSIGGPLKAEDDEGSDSSKRLCRPSRKEQKAAIIVAAAAAVAGKNNQIRDVDMLDSISEQPCLHKQQLPQDNQAAVTDAVNKLNIQKQRKTSPLTRKQSSDADISNVELQSREGSSFSNLSSNPTAIVNPIDPRIDLSTVQVIHAKDHNIMRKDESSMDNSASPGLGAPTKRHANKRHEFLNAYSQVLESCKPFFSRYQETNFEPIVPAKPDPITVTNGTSLFKRPQEESDASSMVVLTRPRRKYKEKKQGDKKNDDPLLEGIEISTANNAMDISSNLKQRKMEASSIANDNGDVDMEDSKPPAKENGNDTTSSSMHSSSTLSSETNEELLRLIARGAEALQIPMNEALARLHPHGNAAADINQQMQQMQAEGPPRIVSDTLGSSSLNTGSGTNSGTGSGTGSGNDTFKNKSENSAESNSNSGGDGTNSDSLTKNVNMDSGYSISSQKQQVHQHAHSAHAASAKHDRHPDLKSSDNHTDHSTQERLAIKKRKRMDKRREYEEEVQRQMQSSSDSSVEQVFEPGQYVTMEDSIAFTNTARLILQSEPPFLAVHCNAAFSRLTGIQNSTVIGRQVANIFSVLSASLRKEASISSRPQESSGPIGQQVRVEIQNEQNSLNTDKSSLSSNENTGIRTDHIQKTDENISIERLIASSGFGKCHLVQTLELKTTNSSSDNSNNESNNSSISSKDPPNKPSIVMMSVCPIMTASAQYSYSQAIKSSVDSSPKRRKHSHNQYRRHLKNASQSHFLVQLFPYQGNVPTNVGINQQNSSNSRHDQATRGSETSGDSSSSKEIVACG